MTTSDSLTVAYARSRLNYNAETGVFTWKTRPGSDRHTRTWNAKYAGTIAGSFDGWGYRKIKIDGAFYRAHRLAWLIVHGIWPRGDIDHVNGTRDDNRLVNLREATPSENNQNQRLRRDNTSGFRGVTADPGRRSRTWKAEIRIDGRARNLGRFVTPDAASRAYEAAADVLHATAFVGSRRDRQAAPGGTGGPN